MQSTSLRAACAAALLASTAHAQQQMPTVLVVGDADPARLTGAPATGSNLGLTRLQTPASVDIIGRAQLDERGDASLVDAVTRAAGLSAMPHPGNGGSSMAARGFTDTVSVMRLYDGLRQYGGAGVTFPFDTWSVERIEVLRGPASVIYGEGAIGGVVNIIPRKPTRGAIRHELQAALGTEQGARLAYGSGGALGARSAYRLDVSGDRSDGWVERGDYRNGAISGALDVDLAPTLKLRVSSAYGRQEPMRYFGVPLVDGAQLPALREQNYNVADSVIAYRDSWTNMEAAWTPDAATTLRSRLYHIRTDRHWRNAETYAWNAVTRLIDRSGNTEILHDSAQTGNTTSATWRTSMFGLPAQFSAGFDASTTRFQHTNNTYVGSSPSVDPFDPEPGRFASSFPTIPRYRSQARQYSLFAENRVEFDPHWSLVAGLRWDHARLARRNLVAAVQEYDRTFVNRGWRLGAVYQAGPQLSLYGQVARAADPIGALVFLSTANSRFEVASGRQVEVGAKRGFWDKRGEATLALYRIAKDNLLTRDATNPARSLQVGRRSSRGIEATVALAWEPGWQLDANAAVLRARFDDFTESVAGVPVARAGNRPPDVPERLANVWISRDIAPGWSASGGLRYVGQRYADNANRLRMPSYTTADLALRWEPASATRLTLRASNLFDRAYFATAYYTTSQWLVGPGRRAELVLDQRF